MSARPPMTDEELAEVISEAAAGFFDEVDPDETDTDDLGWSLVRAIRAAEGTRMTTARPESAEGPSSVPVWPYGAPPVPVTNGGRGPCPECQGRGTRVLPSASAETECAHCEGTGEQR